MDKDLKILIVDDHPMTVNGYVNVLSEEKFEGYNFHFFKALGCEEAYNIIAAPKTRPDIAYLDLSLPPFPEQKLFSGLDLGMLIRKMYPDCIIVFLTMHSEASLVERLIESVAPQGILCKSDIDIDEFLKAFKLIFSGKTHYSNKILKSLKDRTLDNYKLDNYDRQILMRLSEGIPARNIPNYVPLSSSAIEKRLTHIKSLMLDGNSQNDDEALIEAVKKIGIL